MCMLCLSSRWSYVISTYDMESASVCYVYVLYCNIGYDDGFLKGFEVDSFPTMVLQDKCNSTMPQGGLSEEKDVMYSWNTMTL